MKNINTMQYMENRNDEILFEEFLELTERELRSAGIQLLETLLLTNLLMVTKTYIPSNLGQVIMVGNTHQQLTNFTLTELRLTPQLQWLTIN